MWAFWIFIIVMLIWQFYSYNQQLSTPDPQHPTQEHFFFYQPSHAAAAATPVTHDGPYVVQTGFRVQDSTPTDTSFTCHVTLKNTGKAKATGVQVCVRPYRGALDYDPDSGESKGARPGLQDDSSSRASVSQWVSFPDLAPGESSTQSAVFMKDGASIYGINPQPEITFQPEKK